MVSSLSFLLRDFIAELFTTRFTTVRHENVTEEVSGAEKTGALSR